MHGQVQASGRCMNQMRWQMAAIDKTDTFQLAVTYVIAPCWLGNNAVQVSLDRIKRARLLLTTLAISD